MLTGDGTDTKYSAWICEIIGVCKRWETSYVNRLHEIRAECEEAVLAEKERCAKICEGMKHRTFNDSVHNETCDANAAKIREGK